MTDETPRFRLIKGGRLSFSTDDLLAIDDLLRRHLQPVSRFGWVFDTDGSPLSSCGGPVTELTTRVAELVRSLEPSKQILTGLSVPLPPPDTLPCPLVVLRIEPAGKLVATSTGDSLPADYEATLQGIAFLLGRIFEGARGR